LSANADADANDIAAPNSGLHLGSTEVVHVAGDSAPTFEDVSTTAPPAIDVASIGAGIDMLSLKGRIGTQDELNSISPPGLGTSSSSDANGAQRVHKISYPFLFVRI
jgi:hypothetical protein